MTLGLDGMEKHMETSKRFYRSLYQQTEELRSLEEHVLLF